MGFDFKDYNYKKFIIRCQRWMNGVIFSSGLCMLCLRCRIFWYGILTDFGCHHSDIVLHNSLSVQVFISGNGSFNSVNVKTAVRLCVPFQRIPAEIRADHV